MKILKVIVDELPDNCGECYLRHDAYCSVKLANTYVDTTALERNINCPLEQIEEES